MNKIKYLQTLIRSARVNLRSLVKRDAFGVSYWDIQKLKFPSSQNGPGLNILGNPVQLSDPFWHLYSYQEIFVDQIYRFHASRPDPLIIDCGANIGLSVIFFKHLYPDSSILAFEPDPEMYSLLCQNLNKYHFDGIRLFNNAVWMKEEDLAFQSNGSLGGRIIESKDTAGKTVVKGLRLKDYLLPDVDLLKMDIEGAEYEVLEDCQPELQNIKYLFVEYHRKAHGGPELHKMLQILHNAGFRYSIKEAYPVKHPFLLEELRGRTFDLQLNIFAFRDSH